VQDLAIDADFLLLRIDAGAQFRDHAPIDFDAAFLDEVLAFTATGDAGRCEYLLQALAMIVTGGWGRDLAMP
jgi:hypothetical protein